MQTKKWWQSKTIWGVIIATLGFVLNHFLQVPIELPASTVVTEKDFDVLLQSAEKVKEAQGSLGVILSQVMVAVGCFLGIYGRFKAETTIIK